jgi:ribosome-associated protein
MIASSMSWTDETPSELPRERPSKTVLKAQATALQALGQQLAKMNMEQLAAAGVEDPLLGALHDLQRTKSHEGKRRQLQYVGKLMRKVDSLPLQAAVARLQIGPAQEALALHRAETWREAMMASDEAVDRFVAEHAGANANGLHKAVKQCRHEREMVAAQGNGPAKRVGHGTGQAVRQGPAARLLFKLIRPHMG